MFSGIVSSAAVSETQSQGNGLRLSLDLGGLAGELKIGDSVSVNGVCLTVLEIQGSVTVFDAMPETLDKTNLGSLKPGERVNVELPLKLSDRLGGHFVQGHIDGTGKLLKKETQGEYVKLWISATPDLTIQMIPKGSIAMDGVSMTLVDVQKDRFSVAVIPHTLEITTLGTKQPGQHFNIEVDMLGKYIKKQVQGMNRVFKTYGLS